MPILLVLFVPRTRNIVSLLRHFSFLSLVLLQSPSEAAKLDSNYVADFCPGENNTSSGDLFMYSVGTLFNGKLYDEGGRYLYYNATEGDDPNKVYGLYHCYFGVSNEVCQDCIKVAINTIVKNCTGSKEATIWYDQCMVRFSYISFASTLETEPYVFSYQLTNVTDPDKFSNILAQSFNDLIQNATSSESKYAAANQPVNTLVQCVPYLSKSDCNICLRRALALIREHFGKQAGRSFLPSCNIRWDLHPFLEDPHVPISPPNKTGSSDGEFVNFRFLNYL